MNDQDLSTPGGRIRLMRKAKGWTQVTFAAKLHTGQPSVSQWEKNYWLPETAMRRSIAEVLGTTESFLFGEVSDLPKVG